MAAAASQTEAEGSPKTGRSSAEPLPFEAQDDEGVIQRQIEEARQELEANRVTKCQQRLDTIVDMVKTRHPTARQVTSIGELLLGVWRSTRYRKGQNRKRLYIDISDSRSKALDRAAAFVEYSLTFPDIESDPDVLLRLSAAKEQQGLYEDALGILSNIIAYHETYDSLPRTIFRATVLLKHLGNLEKAAEYLEYLQDLSLDEGYGRLHVLSFTCLVWELTRHEGLDAAYEELRKVYLGHLNRNPRAKRLMLDEIERRTIRGISEVWEQLGLQAVDRCEYVLAAEYLFEAQRKAPDKPNILILLAEVLYVLGEVARAHAVAESAFELAPDDNQLQDLLLKIDPGKWFQVLSTRTTKNLEDAETRAPVSDKPREQQHASRRADAVGKRQRQPKARRRGETTESDDAGDGSEADLSQRDSDDSADGDRGRGLLSRLKRSRARSAQQKHRKRHLEQGESKRRPVTAPDGKKESAEDEQNKPEAPHPPARGELGWKANSVGGPADDKPVGEHTAKLLNRWNRELIDRPHMISVQSWRQTQEKELKRHQSQEEQGHHDDAASKAADEGAQVTPIGDSDAAGTHGQAVDADPLQQPQDASDEIAGAVSDPKLLLRGDRRSEELNSVLKQVLRTTDRTWYDPTIENYIAYREGREPRLALPPDPKKESPLVQPPEPDTLLGGHDPDTMPNFSEKALGSMIEEGQSARIAQQVLAHATSHGPDEGHFNGDPYAGGEEEAVHTASATGAQPVDEE